MLPSRSAISPCGPESAVGSGYSRIRPLFGSSLPSLFAFCSVNQREPSGATAGSCGRASGVGRSNSRMETGAAEKRNHRGTEEWMSHLITSLKEHSGLGTARLRPQAARARRHGMEQRRRRDLLVAGIALAAFPTSGAGKKAKEDQQFEEKEHELLGENGFEKAVAEVAELERGLAIFDLAKFTPR